MTEDGAGDSNGVALPSGGGFRAGFGEAFSINLNTGQGTYAVPLTVPEGHAGLTPQIKLEYASAHEQGGFGLGWRLHVREITRRLELGGDGGGVERFLDGGNELMQLPDGSWRACLESAYARYQRTAQGWTVTEKGGLRHELGTTALSRIADPAHPERVSSWLLERTIDPSGNHIDFEHELDAGTPYLQEIRWAAWRLRFLWEARPDVRWNGRAGWLRPLSRRCAAIELRFDDPAAGAPRLLRSWQLRYERDAHTGASLLASIQLVGHGPASDGSGDVARPPVVFHYGGIDAWRSHVRLMEAGAGREPPPLTDADATLCQLDDVPLPGVLRVVNGAHVYWPNLGELRWGEPRPLRDTPRVSALGRAGVFLADMDGNATQDLVVGGAVPLRGYYENGGGARWSRFVAYPRDSAAPPLVSRSVRMADLDGDGRIDALASHGRAFARWHNRGEDGWTGPLLVVRGGDDAPDVDLGDPLMRLADMTGDGQPDLVRIRSGRIEYWPGLGNGRFGAGRVLRGSPRLADVVDAAHEIVLADLDGDGVADLARVGRGGVRVWINQGGEALSPPIVHDIVPPPIAGTLRAVDMLGTGRASLVWNTPRGGRTACAVFSLGVREQPYRLARVEHGTGLVSEITYGSSIDEARRDRSAGAAWPTHLPFAIQVVTATRETDTITGRTTETRFHYHDGHFDPRTRQFQGFGRVEKLERGDDSRPEVATVHLFHAAREREPGATREHAFLNGLLRRVEVYSRDGSGDQERPLRVEDCEHELRVLDEVPGGRQRVAVMVSRSRVTHLERTSDARFEERRLRHDADGNVIEELRVRGGTLGGAAQPELHELHQFAFATGPAGEPTDLVARIVKRDREGRLLGEVHRFYDGDAHVGLPLGQVTRRLLTRVDHLVLDDATFQGHYAGLDAAALGYVRQTDADGDAAWFLHAERSGYDARGVKVSQMDPLGATSTVSLDATGLFRIERRDTLGVTTMRWDPASGNPTEVTDDAGTTVRMAYDALGRLTRVVQAGDSDARPARRYRYDDDAIPQAIHIAYRLVSGEAAECEQVVYHDGAGRELQRRATVGDGRVIVSAYRPRGTAGQILAEYEPTFASSLAFALPATEGRSSRRFHYDGLGRPVRVVNHNGGVSLSAYRPFSIELTDAHGSLRTEELDAGHRRIRVIEAGGAIETRYQPGPFGELAAVSDHRGPMVTYRYDLTGRRLSIQHRDAGDRSLWYDAAGRVVRTLDARGNDVRADYDRAGRLERVSRNGVGIEEYLYDAPAPGAWGRLREVRYTGGRQRFGYDARGRLHEHTWNVDGQAEDFTARYEHDGLGREIRVRYPGALTVEQEYWHNGMLRRVPGVIDLVDYDARCLPIETRHANGVVTRIEYTPGVGRVRHQRTVGPGGAVLADDTYDVDAGEMLTGVTDHLTGVDTLFGHDRLDQLARIESTGAAPLEYRYLGRDLVELGEAGVTLAYDDPAHAGRPNSLRASGAAPFALDYDGNGNTLALPGRRFTWGFKNELVRCERDDGTVADYRYDHRGVRVFKHVQRGAASTTTIFLGDRAEIRDGHAACYVEVGAMRAAVVSGDGVRFIHCDYLGSARFFSDAAGTRLSAIAYHPFGNARDAAEPAEARLFALHAFDAEAGLYYMGRRHYAPELGRFLSPDPLAIFRPEQAGADSRCLALYSYAGNDPGDHVDPSGLSFWSVVGAIVGAAAGVALGIFVLGLFAAGGWMIVLGVALVFAAVTVAYLLAASTSGGYQEFFRGFLIGLNAGLNYAFGNAAGAALFGSSGVGLGIGIGMGMLNFAASIDTVANSEIYQGILGWTNFVMPMSWAITVIGVAFFVVTFVLSCVTFWQVDYLAIKDIQVDWKTGTIFVKGGLFSNLNPIDTAYSIGKFSYVDKDNTIPMSQIIEHEAGHSLSLGAFGTAFHLVAWIDEFAVNRESAFGEKIAESNVPGTMRPFLPMWV